MKMSRENVKEGRERRSMLAKKHSEKKEQEKQGENKDETNNNYQRIFFSCVLHFCRAFIQ
jgi:hypothetical protein